MRVKLKDIGTIITGKTPSTKNKEFWDGNVCFITIEDMNDNLFISNTKRKITDTGLKSLGNNTISGTSILVNCVGNIGAVGITQLTCATNQQINSITNIKDICNPLFLYYKLQTMQKAFEKAAGQTILKILPKTVFENIEIDLPDRKIQDKIAEILLGIDEQINRNNEIVKRLQVLGNTIYSRWFNQFEFPNEKGLPYKSSGGKMVWNEKLKREIPEGWDVKEFCGNNGICHFCKGKIPQKLYNGKSDGYDKYLTLDAISNINVQYCEMKDMPYCDGYTIMVMDGAASGDVYVQKYGVIGSTFAMLVPNNIHQNLSNFIYLYLSANKPFYIKANTGSTIPHANRKFIEKMNVLIPNNFKLFLNTINPIFEQIYHMESTTCELNQLKCQLLPLLINGQLKV